MESWDSRARVTYVRFSYEVRAGDQDADGLSIRADALVLPEGAAITSLATGVAADLDLGAHAIVNDAAHKVSPVAEKSRFATPASTWSTSPYSYETGYLDEERIHG